MSTRVKFILVVFGHPPSAFPGGLESSKSELPHGEKHRNTGESFIADPVTSRLHHLGSPSTYLLHSKDDERGRTRCF
eukprot:scaffold148_cov341-Pavlova_lutheri.AAC.52